MRSLGRRSNQAVTDAPGRRTVRQKYACAPARTTEKRARARAHTCTPARQSRRSRSLAPPTPGHHTPLSPLVSPHPSRTPCACVCARVSVVGTRSSCGARARTQRESSVAPARGLLSARPLVERGQARACAWCGAGRARSGAGPPRLASPCRHRRTHRRLRGAREKIPAARRHPPRRDNPVSNRTCPHSSHSHSSKRTYSAGT